MLLCIIAVHVRGATTRGELSMLTRLNTSQITVLEAAFVNNNYMFVNEATVMQLAQQTGLPERIIRRWFDERMCQERSGEMKGTASNSE